MIRSLISFNQTNVELKRYMNRQYATVVNTFNQTNVELKHKIIVFIFNGVRTFNQTNVELKLNKIIFKLFSPILLIRPMWN